MNKGKNLYKIFENIIENEPQSKAYPLFEKKILENIEINSFFEETDALNNSIRRKYEYAPIKKIATMNSEEIAKVSFGKPLNPIIDVYLYKMYQKNLREYVHYKLTVLNQNSLYKISEFSKYWLPQLISDMAGEFLDKRTKILLQVKSKALQEENKEI